jgi:hypothetical protein
MANIDNTSDLTLSQPNSTAPDVAQVILDLCCNSQREDAMPWISGALTTASYIKPWLARAMRPMLERRGANVKARLRRQR